jgi:hypothetical protein
VLERFEQVAGRLAGLLPVAVLVGVAGAGLFLWAAATGTRSGDGASDDGLLILGLIAALWGALLFALITGFREVPAQVDTALPWFRRMRARLRRAAYLLMAWVMLGAAGVAVMMTYRLAMLWMG